MQELFIQFVREPTPENYFAIRRAVVESEAYRPYTEGLQAVSELFDDGKHQEVLEAAQVIMANFLLTPDLHFFLGRSHAELGNEEAEKLEAHLFIVCRDALMATGDGTPSKPFLVTQAEDQLAIMAVLKREATKQALVKHEDGRIFDVWTDDSDTEETWFDISDLVQRTPEMSKLLEDPSNN